MTTMKSASYPQSAGDKLILLTEEPLSLVETINQVRSDASGAVVSFSGTVRGIENGFKIRSITYEVYREMAVKKLSEIAAESQKRWGVTTAIRHRTGKVATGEASVICACSAAHRGEAFLAAQFVIDQIKLNVPIWKVGYEWENL